MELISVSPMDISFPSENNEFFLRPEPKETDKDWQKTLDLKAIIEKNGMQDLFSCRPLGNNKYVVINGSRRTKVCQMLCEEGHPDFQQISIQVNDISEIESLEHQISGNATVLPTNPKQYAAALVKVAIQKQYNVNELAKAVGRSPGFVNNMLRFNRLPDEIQDLVATNHMPVTNAVALTKLPKDMELGSLVNDACEMDTSKFALKVKESVDNYAAEKRAAKDGKAPEFELTEKKINNDQIKANLEKAKNLVEDDPSDFNRGYLTALQEIFQIDEKSEAKRKAEWEAKQEEKERKKEERKKSVEEKKKEELKKYIKDNKITSLDQLTA